MIIVKLKGGLGNQMFQYAMGRKLSILKKTELKLDIGASPEVFQKNAAREYSLGHFNIKATFAIEKEVKKLKYPFGIFSKFSRAYQFWILKRQKIGFDSKYLEIKQDAYVDGYWHNEKYFIDIKDIILEDFSLKDPLSSAGVTIASEIQKSSETSVSLHVRRGDFASDPGTLKYHGLMTTEYYGGAIQIMKNKVGNIKIFVFSDDIEWVKKNIPFSDPHVYVTNPAIPFHEEVYLMSLCKNNIIANSSFSWWGAWLNKNPNKIVIAPEKWLAKTGSDYYKEIPPTWTKI